MVRYIWINFIYRKSVYDEPILLNIEEKVMKKTNSKKLEGKETSQPIKRCFYEMKATKDYCFFISDEGYLYVMGKHRKGLLGLGEKVTNT